MREVLDRGPANIRSTADNRAGGPDLDRLDHHGLRDASPGFGSRLGSALGQPHRGHSIGGRDLATGLLGHFGLHLLIGGTGGRNLLRAVGRGRAYGKPGLTPLGSDNAAPRGQPCLTASRRSRCRPLWRATNKPTNTTPARGTILTMHDASFPWSGKCNPLARKIPGCQAFSSSRNSRSVFSGKKHHGFVRAQRTLWARSASRRAVALASSSLTKPAAWPASSPLAARIARHRRRARAGVATV